MSAGSSSLLHGGDRNIESDQKPSVRRTQKISISNFSTFMFSIFNMMHLTSMPCFLTLRCLATSASWQNSSELSPAHTCLAQVLHMLTARPPRSMACVLAHVFEKFPKHIQDET